MGFPGGGAGGLGIGTIVVLMIIGYFTGINPAILIGGADGLDPSLRDRADLVLSFGAMVWPHMLVRVMLAEQLYRAATILAGGPYHRA